MAASQQVYVDVARLSVGLFIHLDLGWMDHPFSLNSFKIRSQEQIDTLRSLGVKQVRYCPEKSDPEARQIAEHGLPPAPPLSVTPSQNSPVAVDAPLQRHRALLAQQRASLQQCERKFGDAAKAIRLLYK